MESIVVEKHKLLDKLNENLHTHRDTYVKAVEEYKRQQEMLLARQLEDVREGRKIDPFALSRMAVPEDHTDDYKIAIEMLELDVNDKVELGAGDFRRFWRDEWEWRRSWESNTRAYVSG
jgi:hypothetical protein